MRAPFLRGAAAHEMRNERLQQSGDLFSPRQLLLNIGAVPSQPGEHLTEVEQSATSTVGRHRSAPGSHAADDQPAPVTGAAHRVHAPWTPFQGGRSHRSTLGLPCRSLIADCFSSLLIPAAVSHSIRDNTQGFQGWWLISPTRTKRNVSGFGNVLFRQCPQFDTSR